MLRDRWVLAPIFGSASALTFPPPLPSHRELGAEMADATSVSREC